MHREIWGAPTGKWYISVTIESLRPSTTVHISDNNSRGVPKDASEN